MTKLELQTKANTDIRKYLENLDMVKVDITNIPGFMSLYPDCSEVVGVEAYLGYVRTFYRLVEDYIKAYTSEVKIVYEEDSMHLVF